MNTEKLAVVAEFLMEREIKQFENTVRNCLNTYVKEQQGKDICFEDMYEAVTLDSWLKCNRGNKPFFEWTFNEVFNDFIDIDLYLIDRRSLKNKKK